MSPPAASAPNPPNPCPSQGVRGVLSVTVSPALGSSARPYAWGHQTPHFPLISPQNRSFPLTPAQVSLGDVSGCKCAGGLGTRPPPGHRPRGHGDNPWGRGGCHVRGALRNRALSCETGRNGAGRGERDGDGGGSGRTGFSGSRRRDAPRGTSVTRALGTVTSGLPLAPLRRPKSCHRRLSPCPFPPAVAVAGAQVTSETKEVPEHESE